jgi:hypothetical protein
MNHSLHIKLSKGNFMAWRTHILAYIKGQDAFGFLNGSSQPPTQAIPHTNIAVGASVTMVNPDFLAWCQRDQMILSVLIFTLTEPCGSSSWLCYNQHFVEHLGHHVCILSPGSCHADLLSTCHGQ